MDKVIFRSSMAGYNKKDVNKYISDVDARHALETEEASVRVAKLEAELAALRLAEDEDRRKLENANNKITELEGKLEAADAELGELRDKCGKAEDEASAHAREVQALRAKLAEVPGNVPTSDELEDLRRRAAAYDELDARKLTSPQYGAAAEADNVIRSAYNEAERIRQEALRCGSAAACEEIKGQMSGEISEIYELINRTAAESLDDILANMRSAEAGVGKLSEELYDKNRMAVVRVEKLRAEIERLVEQKLAESMTAAEKANALANDGASENAKSGKNIGINSNSNKAKNGGANNDAVSATSKTAVPSAVSDTGHPTHRSVRREKEREHSASKQHREDGIFRFGRRK